MRALDINYVISVIIFINGNNVNILTAFYAGHAANLIEV